MEQPVPTVWEEAFDEAQQFAEAQQTVEPLSSDLNTLLELGKLEETVEIGNRKVTLRTLKVGEELEVGLLTKEYQSSSEQLRAEITAIVAASIVSIDGKPLITSFGPDEITFRDKFNYVNNNFYWPVIRMIYKSYTDLLDRVEESLKEFNKKKD